MHVLLQASCCNIKRIQRDVKHLFRTPATKRIKVKVAFNNSTKNNGKLPSPLPLQDSASPVFPRRRKCRKAHK